MVQTEPVAALHALGSPLPHGAVAPRATIAAALRTRCQVVPTALAELEARVDALVAIAERLAAALRVGRTVLVAGNGGSAAQAQHFATELVGRFQRERDGFAVLALTADTALLTAVANDYGYAHVFARQVRALGRPGDVLVLFSTSGASENLVRAAWEGRRQGLEVVAVVGDRPGPLVDAADLALRVPSTDTPLTQELHTLVIHLLCEAIESDLTGTRPGRGAAP